MDHWCGKRRQKFQTEMLLLQTHVHLFLKTSSSVHSDDLEMTIIQIPMVLSPRLCSCNIISHWKTPPRNFGEMASYSPGTKNGRDDLKILSQPVTRKPSMTTRDESKWVSNEREYALTGHRWPTCSSIRVETYLFKTQSS